MSSVLDQMLKEVLLHPDDDTIRLIMADCYSDNGQEEHGEFIRCQIELAQLGNPYPEMNGGRFQGGTLYTIESGVALCNDLSTVPKVGDRIDLHLSRIDKTRRGLLLEKMIEVGRLSDNTPEYNFFFRRDEKSKKFPIDKYTLLKEREKELLQSDLVWFPLLDNIPFEDWDSSYDGHINIRIEDSSLQFSTMRGFISQVTCSSATWIKYADYLIPVIPIEEVTLTDNPEWDYVDSDMQIAYMRVGGHEGEGIHSSMWIDEIPEGSLIPQQLLQNYWRKIKFNVPQPPTLP